MLADPLLALFVVAAIGYLAGKVRVGRMSLGVAAVLFAGLVVSALSPELEVPPIVPHLGLALFIYAIGLSAGPGFFKLFRARGLRDGGLALAAVLVSAAVTVLLSRALGLSAQTAAGLFCGGLTNTPALAAVVERLPADTAALPVVAYSVAYPFGVLGVLAAIVLVQRVLRLDYASERPSVVDPMVVGETLSTATFRVRDPRAIGAALGALERDHPLHVRFVRHRRGDTLTVADEYTVLADGDLLTAVGSPEGLERACALLGERCDEHPELDRSVLDMRRVFVSNPDVVERPIRELHLHERFGAAITRIRRGEVELLADDDAELEPGDRVRVVAPRDRMAALGKFLGDSYHALAEIDALTFGLGVALGLLLGSVPIPLPSGGSFELGVAGGPLIAGLVLGRIGRTGPLVWAQPYSANVTLRQFGLLLFLGGVGLRSGAQFVQTVASAEGLALLGAGAAVTLASALVTLLVGRLLLRVPFAVLTGTVAGIHTQPAVLAFAHEQAKSELPRLGYTAVFPVASVVKIVVAQVVLALS
ncbi:MAG: transporter [Sandaracinaceae bacterium]|nr:transporter [Sandaracinaceae bacterium]